MTERENKEKHFALSTGGPSPPTANCARKLSEERSREQKREEKREEKLQAVAEAPKPIATQPPADVPKRSQPFENLVRMLGSNAAMVLGAYAESAHWPARMLDPEAAGN